MTNDIGTVLSDKGKIYKLSIVSSNDDNTRRSIRIKANLRSFVNDKLKPFFKDCITLLSIFTSNTISLLTTICAINCYWDLQVNNSIPKFYYYSFN